MLKVITTVGTSIFENYLKKSANENVKRHIEALKDRFPSDRESESSRIKLIVANIQEFIDKKIKDGKQTEISAEIKSLVKLQDLLKGKEIEVYLLCSDTLLGVIAGEILESVLKDKLNFKVNERKIIKDLQIWDGKKFRDGLGKLITEIYNIAQGYWDNVIINITGGFKATVPYLTILAQINQCPIYYIFEDTDALIKIPYIPLDIKWKIFEDHYELFYKLERERIIELKEDYKRVPEDVLSLLEEADNYYELNPLGIALWEKYKQKYSLFSVSEEVLKYIEDNKDREKIVNKSLLELRRRLEQNINDPDLNHGLSGVKLYDFKVFKHKENNLQVRILYKFDKRRTAYETYEYDIYVELVSIGSDVHNAGNEYVKHFEEYIKNQKNRNIDNYKVYKIYKEEQNV